MSVSSWNAAMLEHHPRRQKHAPNASAVSYRAFHAAADRALAEIAVLVR
jgi:hypothetical protein